MSQSEAPQSPFAKQKLVIIGAGMAGSKLAHAMAIEHGDQYQVTLIGEEAQVGYNRIMLSSLLAQEVSEDDIGLVDLDAMTQSGALIIASDPVIDINLSQKHLNLQSGREISFDKLVFATGARARKLDVPGVNCVNVTQFRDLSDVAFMSKIQEKSEVCVIGAGLLGLEAAVGMAKRGHQVSMVHRADYILNRQLDKDSAHLLQKSLEKNSLEKRSLDKSSLEKIGIRFHLGSAPTEFVSTNADANAKIEAVKLASGKLIKTDLVILATGIKPEVELAKAAGLTVNKAICVNQVMRTSHQDVFALGECSEFEQVTFGLVAPIWQQFDVLVDHLTQKQSRFKIEAVATKLKVSGINLFSAGEVNSDSSSESITYRDSAQNQYRKLVIKEGVLVGAILYGNVADASWYFQLIQNKTKVSKILDQLVFGEAYCHALVQGA
ncbi:FAD-dependent pyridine nucleotide-disulfide oxidoreductase [Marinomonas sp. MED121]|uniref:NAD(P)/FAD-dependent oxidoreductase n=1 Tax=Marinomonas sp. MED121 TaxID=314277 RepID=UPI000068FE55|nr:FAD-dependent oxidoreductase [Marinomonas sp. MED121]EAQ66842.1 FAD-dependent pyridine nucleotide-disulfide oxidoreductase [Marinomonas sp. MED121]